MSSAFETTLGRQKAASDPETSAWVAANAGTGKTHVLTQRVIRLLLAGTKPERILCLTFTKAAASEMASRLYKTLGRWTTLADEPLTEAIAEVSPSGVETTELPAARRLFAQALETPGGLKIQTIHAFCERVLGRFPLEAGIPPHFQILDESAAIELKARARAAVLRTSLGESDTPLAAAVKTVLAYADEYKLERLLDEISANGSKLARTLPSAVDGLKILENLRTSHGLAKGDTAETLLGDAFDPDVWPKQALLNACDALEQGGVGDQGRAASLRQCLVQTDRQIIYDGYRSIFLTKEGEPRKRLVTKSVSKNHPNLEDLLLDEQDRLLKLVEKIAAIKRIALTESAYLIAEFYLQNYAGQKAQISALDYDDLIICTQNLLANSSQADWVLYKLDGGIDHILVDEAQDTSPGQWQVIQELAGEFFAGQGVANERAPGLVRTVFAVGDEKQSIYSFQGADPDKFHDMKDHFARRVEQANKPWRSMDLNLSFRSTTEVLTAVDAVFSGADMAGRLTGSGDYVSHDVFREGEPGLVELWPLVSPLERESTDPWDAPLDNMPADSPAARLAEQIARLIKSWLESDECLASTSKRIRPSDILILVRRRNAFMNEMIRQLRKNGVPVAGADRLALTDHIAVMDLLALIQFVLLPEDDLTLATVLKGPLFGLSESDLFELSFDRDGSLWSSLRSSADEGPAGSFASSYRLLKRLRDMADHVTPYVFLKRVLDGPDAGASKHDRSAFQAMLERLGVDAAEPIEELLSLALDFESNQIPSLQGFHDWIVRRSAELIRDHDHERNEVRVMTVHGAKGLQSGIVFLPDTTGVPDGRHDPIILPLESGEFVWSADKDKSGAAVSDDWDKFVETREAEYRRLLYVAMTRACDRLYICGYEGEREPKDTSWYRLVEVALAPIAQSVELFTGETGLRIGLLPMPSAPSSGEGRVLDIGLVAKDELPQWLRQAAPKAKQRVIALTPSQATGAATAQAPIAPVLADAEANRAVEYGRLVHSFLEQLPGLDAEQCAAAVRHISGRHGSQLGEEICARAAEEAMGVLSHPDFAALFGRDSRAEVPLTGMVEGFPQGTVFTGQIDRLLVSDRQVIVVDFKTGRPPADGEVPISYARQMAIYRAMLQSIYPETPVTCGLLWTQVPQLTELSGELLARALEGAIAAHDSVRNPG